MTKDKTKRPLGFAALSQERRKEIASSGGRAAHRSGHAHEFTSEEARSAVLKRNAARADALKKVPQ